VITRPDIRMNARAGYLFPIEGECWTVLVGEYHGNQPPADADEFMESVRQIRTTTIHDAIKDAKRLDKIHRFRFPESSWRRYERLNEMPRGLLPIGDAICRFNPIYGQGMTVAAQEACILMHLLQKGTGAEKDPLAGLAQDFIDAAQPVIAAAWSTAAVPDFAYPQTRGDRPADLENSLRFGAALTRLAARDPAVHKLMIGVRQLIEPPSVLRDPELVRRVQAEMAEA
jgi:2-polyprenyl-6-methoxyphenol hydroxylase-like FAD-dependent oxidoreductase